MIISAILLAAGQSKRMAQIKQLLPLGQTTIVGRIIDNLLNSAISETIVVLGYKADKIRKTIASKPIKITINPDYQQGMSTSIITGLKQIDKRASAVLIALGDQPFVDSQTTNDLIEAFVSGNKGITIPVCHDRRGNPVIFSVTYKNELLNLKGDVGGREVINRHPDDVLEVTTSCEGVLVDIDTMEDYNSTVFNSHKQEERRG